MGMFWWIPFGKVPEVSPEQLERMRLDIGNRVQIVDVRTGMEWRASHIPGAVSVPVTEFAGRLESLGLDKSRPVVAICLSAHRSIPAVRTLRKNGFRDAYQLKGGMLSWWKAKFPIEGDGNAPPPANCQ
ncbi:rhodanese-like domain-containing protein [Ramlibacter sp. 2FC]|uniref:rhodanese-like domain-containing protein n=1 Tax=Ramlibacter sp. 2FC TaxID=2502188 RepID=UPI0010F9BA96|nr:rhodanese-like domain-containing protein [Ramlibacter sp. 2FC]